jgi:protein TonB
MRIARWMAGALVALAVVLAAPSSAAAQSPVYEMAQLSAKPRIASPMAAQRAIEGSYPRSLRSLGVAGQVVLQFIVGPDGAVDVSSIQVQSADDDRLQEPAKKGLAQIQFVPGEVDGQPVATRVVFPVRFVSN